jgi:hypothetical protein
MSFQKVENTNTLSGDDSDDDGNYGAPPPTVIRLPGHLPGKLYSAVIIILSKPASVKYSIPCRNGTRRNYRYDTS